MHCDAALRKVVQPPIISEQQYDQRDPDPCPLGDNEFFETLDADSMEETISKFMDGLEAQERSGFDDIHRLIQCLPLPVTKAIRSMTHVQASKHSSCLIWLRKGWKDLLPLNSSGT